MNALSHELIDTTDWYFHKLTTEDDLVILFGWDRRLARVALFITRDLEGEGTVYDTNSDEFLLKGSLAKGPHAQKIRYFEETIVEILGPEYRLPLSYGFDIYMIILNESVTKQEKRKKNDRQSNAKD